MKVVSTNLAEVKTIIWNGKEEQTGIYKVPVDEPIYLGSTDVKGDAVIDRRYHGGVNQACYLYAAKHYSFWKNEYPEMELPYGMFGENLTIEGLDETVIMVGAIYQIGGAKVQVTEPRQPCYKLGVRFDDPYVVKKFLGTTFSGVYLRVLENGEVKTGDEMILVEEPKEGLTIANLYELIFAKTADPELLRLLIAGDHVPQRRKEKILAKHGLL
ncbi:MAG: MOSC domain-containing protein [Reichenbachiella sp.]